MSQPADWVARRVLERWAAGICPAAAAYHLDDWLVRAVVCQESRGDPRARRPEPRFLEARRGRIEQILRATKAPDARARYLEWWETQPIVFATSFGLMQVLNIVAIERGIVLETPDAMANDPPLSLEAGCRQLRYCFELRQVRVATEPITAALTRYNGGPTYAGEVLAWEDCLRRVAREAPPA